MYLCMVSKISTQMPNTHFIHLLTRIMDMNGRCSGIVEQELMDDGRDDTNL